MMTRRPLPDYTVILRNASAQIRELLDAPHPSDEVRQARVELAGAIWSNAVEKLRARLAKAQRAIISEQ